MLLKNVCVLALCLLLFCAGSAAQTLAQAASAPIISPAAVRNGLRFETWLVSPIIIIPDKSVGDIEKPATMFSVRMTNLTRRPLRINPYALTCFMLVGPTGEALDQEVTVIHHSLGQRQEANYLLIQPAQSLVLPTSTFLWWPGNHLRLSWYSGLHGHAIIYEGVLRQPDGKHPNLPINGSSRVPFAFQGLTAGTYRLSMQYTMRAQAVPIYDEHTFKVVKTLNGFWTGNVILPPLTFQLVHSSD